MIKHYFNGTEIYGIDNKEIGEVRYVSDNLFRPFLESDRTLTITIPNILSDGGNNGVQFIKNWKNVHGIAKPIPYKQIDIDTNVVIFEGYIYCARENDTSAFFVRTVTEYKTDFFSLANKLYINTYQNRVSTKFLDCSDRIFDNREAAMLAIQLSLAIYTLGNAIQLLVDLAAMTPLSVGAIILQSAYIAILIVNLIETIGLIRDMLPKLFELKVYSIHSIIEEGCKELGYTLESNILVSGFLQNAHVLDWLYYDKKYYELINIVKSENAISELNPTTTLLQFMDSLARFYNLKIQVIGKVVRFEKIIDFIQTKENIVLPRLASPKYEEQQKEDIDINFATVARAWATDNVLNDIFTNEAIINEYLINEERIAQSENNEYTFVYAKGHQRGELSTNEKIYNTIVNILLAPVSFLLGIDKDKFLISKDLPNSLQLNLDKTGGLATPKIVFPDQNGKLTNEHDVKTDIVNIWNEFYADLAPNGIFGQTITIDMQSSPRGFGEYVTLENESIYLRNLKNNPFCSVEILNLDTDLVEIVPCYIESLTKDAKNGLLRFSVKAFKQYQKVIDANGLPIIREVRKVL